MYFAQPHWLWLLVLVPLVGYWQAWRMRRNRGMRFSGIGPVRRTPASFWGRVALAPVLLRMAALSLGILALARPQERNVALEKEAEGIDILLVLDTSTSMNAQDFKPDRFEAAREVASSFIEGRISDRIGIVVFAARAFTQAPLTLDYSFLQQMLAEVQTGIIEDGTAIGTALAIAANRLRHSEAKSKVIILLTDGENNRGEIDPVTAADIAATLGVRVYAIGVGKQGLAPYVIDHPLFGKQIQMVPVEIDEEMLRTVAARTGGRYFRAVDEQALRTIYDEIGRLEQTKIDERVYTDYQERYARFLFPALGLVLLEVLLTSTRLRRFP